MKTLDQVFEDLAVRATHVQQYNRTTKTGAVVSVREHEDSRMSPAKTEISYFVPGQGWKKRTFSCNPLYPRAKYEASLASMMRFIQTSFGATEFKTIEK